MILLIMKGDAVSLPLCIPIGPPGNWRCMRAVTALVQLTPMCAGCNATSTRVSQRTQRHCQLQG